MHDLEHMSENHAARKIKMMQPRKRRASIPFSGVMIDSQIVKSQKYLKAHNLPHSEVVAGIELK